MAALLFPAPQQPELVEAGSEAQLVFCDPWALLTGGPWIVMAGAALEGSLWFMNPWGLKNSRLDCDRQHRWVPCVFHSIFNHAGGRYTILWVPGKQGHSGPHCSGSKHAKIKLGHWVPVTNSPF